MNRRDLLKASGMTAVGLLMTLPKRAHAEGDESPPAELQLTGEIDRNHGHAFTALSLTQVVQMLQQVHRDAAPVMVNIQGASRHPHTLTLTEEVLLKVLVEGQAGVDSSTDASHSHPVTLMLAQ